MKHSLSLFLVLVCAAHTEARNHYRPALSRAELFTDVEAVTSSCRKAKYIVVTTWAKAAADQPVYRDIDEYGIEPFLRSWRQHSPQTRIVIISTDDGSLGAMTC